MAVTPRDDIENTFETSNGGLKIISPQSESQPDTGDAEYVYKCRIINTSIQEIGMGKYQWRLFIVVGFGYFSDNAWPIVTGLILPAIIPELTSATRGPFLKLGQNIGLLVGATFWGMAADIWGRKISFTLTLLITGLFSLCAVFSRDYTTLIGLGAAWSVGVGGNLPVDSSIFLEFLPGTHQYLLTVLSIWWAFGQLITSLLAWPLIGNFSCTPLSVCHPHENRGWRYLLLVLSLLTFSFAIVRLLWFELYESPKFLMGRGMDLEAVSVVKKVGEVNGKQIELSADALTSTEDYRKKVENDQPHDAAHHMEGEGKSPILLTARSSTSKLGPSSAFLYAKLPIFEFSRIKLLFVTRKLAYSTSLLIVLWALIGLAFPLYNSFVTYYLATRGAYFGDGSTYVTYRNQVILSVVGVPGAFLAGYMVEMPLLGRRGTLSLFTVLTGVFILLSLTSRSSPALLGWNCAYTFTSNIMYGVLYALTPELFPTRERGTGNALCAGANRVFGVMAPIIALYANITTSVPIFISGTVFILAGLIALTLPYEPRGKAAL